MNTSNGVGVSRIGVVAFIPDGCELAVAPHAYAQPPCLFAPFADGSDPEARQERPKQMQSQWVQRQGVLEVQGIPLVQDQDAQESDLQRDINKIYKGIDSRIPKISFQHFDNTTSAKKSSTVIINQKDVYCAGDSLIVQVDSSDYLGKAKTYGGDFLMARIYSPDIKGSTSGRIEDFGNGTYHVHFTLFWQGTMRVYVLLIHPSEGVLALWQARNKGHGYVAYTGKFIKGETKVVLKCRFDLNRTQELCECSDLKEEEYFYCLKPENMSCASLINMSVFVESHSYLSDMEKTIFDQLKPFNLYRVNSPMTRLFIDMERNVKVLWRKHANPFIMLGFHTYKEEFTVFHQIDEIGGNQNTIITFTLGVHFRLYPIEHFIRRAINIQRATKRLLLQSTDTKIIIKTENTTEMDIRIEMPSDFHGYLQYLIINEIFQDLNVGIVDACDMTNAFASNNIHPPVQVVSNEVDMFLNYIC
ncbi:NXPE family member 4-like [Discoglossus pictus]